MVIVSELDGNRIAVHVDPSSPNAWRTEPHYGDIKTWAHAAARTLDQLIVVIGRKTIAILPDRDVDLGKVADDEVILIGRRADGSLDAVKRKADHPEVAGMIPGKKYSM